MIFDNCLKFISYCDHHLANDTEYNIVSSLYKHIGAMKNITVQHIALEANTSVASVSRFIKKAGFSAFAEFRTQIDLMLKNFLQMRREYCRNAYSEQNAEEMVESIRKSAVEHINRTANKINIAKLQETVKILKNSQKVIFVGEIRELADFGMLQMNLMAMGIPTYMFSQDEFMENCLAKTGIDQRTAVVFLSVSNAYNRPGFTRALHAMEDRNAAVIVISQDESFSGRDVAVNLRYGIAGSKQSGYYSLSFLNTVLCDFLML